MAMPSRPRFKPAHFGNRSRQHGAVLYVALIMLILLSLIGTIGMRVAGLQERMAANYRDVNAAFQAGEGGARQIEDQIEAALAAGGTFRADDERGCNFEPSIWADDSKTDQSEASHTARIDSCFAGASRVVGRKKNEDTGNVYRITALRSNENRTSSAVIDTIYIP